MKGIKEVTCNGHSVYLIIMLLLSLQYSCLENPMDGGAS